MKAAPDKVPVYDSRYLAQPGTSKTPEAATQYVRLLRRHIAGPARVLDVGCGSGAVLACLAGERRWELAGVDISQEAVASARRFAAKVVVGDAARLPFGSEYFDAVLLLDVIEHLDAPTRALEEARRVVRENGILIVSTPNAGSPLRPLLGRRWHGLRDSTHLYFFTKFSLTYLLSQTGWRPLSVQTFSSARNPIGAILEKGGVGGELSIVAKPL